MFSSLVLALKNSSLIHVMWIGWGKWNLHTKQNESHSTMSTERFWSCNELLTLTFNLYNFVFTCVIFAYIYLMHVSLKSTLPVVSVANMPQNNNALYQIFLAHWIMLPKTLGFIALSPPFGRHNLVFTFQNVVTLIIKKKCYTSCMWNL